MTGILPGFANTHSHAFHRALRGRTHANGGTFWTWREQMYRVARVLDPDRYLALARAVYAEMALAGITGVGEFHYVHHQPGGRPYADPNAMGAALAQAAGEAGIRITLLDTCYLAGGLSADGHTPLSDDQQRFSDRSVDAWAERALARPDWGPHVRLGAAIHSVRAVPPDDLATMAQVLRQTDWPVHVHLSEQPAENEACLAHYGRTPTQLLADAGLLDHRLTAVHATHLTQGDVSALAGAQARVSFCPTTERDLADGIGPARALHDAGVQLTLGSDQHAVIDMFEEMRAVEAHERLVTHERGRFTPAQLLHMASGWAALGWDDPDDLVEIDDRSARTAGCAPDQLHYAATAADVRRVVAAGTTIVEDGRHRLGDIGTLLTEALEDLR